MTNGIRDKIITVNNPYVPLSIENIQNNAPNFQLNMNKKLCNKNLKKLLSAYLSSIKNKNIPFIKNKRPK